MIIGTTKNTPKTNAQVPSFKTEIETNQFRQISFDNLINKAEQNRTVRVIVGLNTEFQPDGKLPELEKSEQRTAIKTAQNNFINRYQTFRGDAVTKFEYIPYLALEVNQIILRAMQTDNSIRSIEEDIIADAALAESTPIVGAPAAWNSGFTGSGQTVAILDSGDGKADIALYRPSSGNWYRLNSSNGAFVAVAFGISEDKPTAADYDGDGKTDISVFRPSTGNWYRLNSSTGAFVGISFGISGDKPTPADFDGDGKADIAVFRPSNGAWYRLNSGNGAFFATAFGIAEDNPTPNAFIK